MIESYDHRIELSDASKAIIERATSEQWGNQLTPPSILPELTFDIFSTEQLSTLKSLSDMEGWHASYIEQALEDSFGRFADDFPVISSQLDCNRYTRLEAERLFKQGESSDVCNEQEREMLVQQRKAIDFLLAHRKTLTLDREGIHSLNAFSQNRHISEERLNHLLNALTKVENPFEQTFFILAYFPFACDPLTSRLAANIPLLKNNLCPISYIKTPRILYSWGLQAIQRFNEHALLRDVFMWIYKYSSIFYSSVADQAGRPNPYGMRYHEWLKLLSTIIIEQILDKKMAIKVIRQRAENSIPDEDRYYFIENIEEKLQALATRDFEPWGYDPEKFRAWQKNWH